MFTQSSKYILLEIIIYHNENITFQKHFDYRHLKKTRGVMLQKHADRSISLDTNVGKTKIQMKM